MTGGQRRRWTWQTDGPRVVLECAGPDSPEIIAEVIRKGGYEVAICTGPDDHDPCDLLTQGACALVDEADVVVNLLHSKLGDEVGVRVASARRPPALVAETGPSPGPNAANDADPRVVTISRRVNQEQLLASIREALHRKAGPPPTWGDGTP
jgi:hypothetical protein